MEFIPEIRIKRSKSLLSSYSKDSQEKSDCTNSSSERSSVRTYSDSSADICVIYSDDDCADAKPKVDGAAEHTVPVEGDLLTGLEQKINKLSETFLEHCNLLKTLKEEIRNSKTIMEKTEHAHTQLLVNAFNKNIAQRNESFAENSSSEESEPVNSRAKSLLSAIETKRSPSLDADVKRALVNFLQSDDLKEHMVRATAASVKNMIEGCLSRDVSSLYLPVLESSHRRHLAHINTIVEQAFVDLEEKSSSLFKCVYKTSGALRFALERHHRLLEAASDPGKNLIETFQYAVEEILHKELAEWRQKVLDMFTRDSVSPEPLDYIPTTPLQPADPEGTVIDQLMQTAFINKKIQDGDVNGSFEHALSASDLSLVMAACRRADPATVFKPPCILKQHVLLSLAQQLATDMVHETQLKCRYLEEAIINLNASDPDTRAHLPLVVGEVRRHLSRFLTSYPNHIASRRITLIVMAANNLLK